METTYIVQISIIFIVFCVQSSQQSCVSADMADYTDCGGILIGNEGVVKRPSQNYRKSAYCKWTITQDEGFGFKIKVKNMKLEDEGSVGDRCKDNLMIESEQINNKERKILCGGYDIDSEVGSEYQQDEEENFFIPTRQINVTFCSSVLPQDKIDLTDFQLKWSVVTTVEEPAPVVEENDGPIPFLIEEFRAPPAQERRMQCRRGICHENAVCQETMFGRAKCMCRPGYMGDGKLSCIDINECHESQAASTCDPNASCINLPGTFTCHCPLGFSGDGQTCTEKPHGTLQSGGCRFDSCSEESDCITSDEGGHYCVCKDGFTGNGDSCRDIDECSEDENVCNGFMNTCENTIGSYICHHPSQYFPIVTERQEQPQQSARSDYVRMIQRLREMFQGEEVATETTTSTEATTTTIRSPPQQQIVRRLSILERIRARVVNRQEEVSSTRKAVSSSTQIVTDSPSLLESAAAETEITTQKSSTSSSGGSGLITRSRLLIALQTAIVTVAMAMFD